MKLVKKYQISEEEADAQFRRGTAEHTDEYLYETEFKGLEIRAFGAKTAYVRDDVVMIRFFVNGKFIGRKSWYCHRDGKNWYCLPIEKFVEDLECLSKKINLMKIGDGLIYIGGSESMFNGEGYAIDMKNEKLIELDWFDEIDLARGYQILRN